MSLTASIASYLAVDEPEQRRSFSFHPLFIAVAAGCAYYVGALFGNLLKFPNHAPSALWPPNSILLSALLLTPKRFWWTILLGAFPAHLFVQLQSGVPLVMSLAWFSSNSFEALLGAVCVRHFVGEHLDFDSLKACIVFVFFAAFLAPFVSSFLDAGFVVLIGWKADAYWQVWRMRCRSNVLASLTLVPVIVLWARNATVWFRNVSWQRCVEAALLAIGLVGVSLFVFDWYISGRTPNPALVYLPLPFLLWAAVRFGPGGCSTSIVMIVLISIWGATQGRGPFSGLTPTKNVESLQLFLLAISLPLLFLAAVVEDARKKTQILSDSESRFRMMADTAPVLIWMSGADTRFTFFNKGWLDFTGRSAEQELGDGWSEGVHREDLSRCMNVYTGAFAKRAEFVMEYRLRRRDGEYRWITDNGRPRFAPDGTLLGYVGSAFDITDRRKAQARLQTQYLITHLVAESVSFAAVAPKILETICETLDWQFGEIWLVDPQINRLILSNTWHRRSEGLEEFATGSRQFSFVPGAGLPGRVWESHQVRWISRVADDDNFLRSALATKAGLRSAFGFPIVLGAEMLGVVSFFSGDERTPDQPLLDLMGSIGDQIGQFIERKRGEEELRESEERLRLALEAGRMGVWDSDLRTRKVKWSKEHFTILGLEPFSIDPSHLAWSQRVHPEDLPRVLTSIERAIAERKNYRCEYRVLLPNGSSRWVESQAVPIYDGGQECVRVRGLVVDITERKQAEDSLSQALAQVQQLKLRLEADNIYLRQELSQTHRFGNMIGQSRGIRQVFEQVEQVALTDMTVLILGETGVGKELVARWLHEKSGRRDRPLVKVNCSALPSELIESELFGHERGAFTGAVSRQVGRFEFADRGTIFLDEVGELPLNLQAKLLRVLQDGEFERLGSGKTIKVDVRVIAATNRNLREAVERGRFRADLYYRLNVYPVTVPPLRERREDIQLLAQAFLDEAAPRLGKRFKPIPADIVKALVEYDWPGNVRELENLIARTAVVSHETLQLPGGWNEEGGALASLNGKDTFEGASGSQKLEATTDQENATLGEREKAYVLKILDQTNWRIEGPKGAALVLGLHPNTLRSRMERMGIKKPRKPRNPVV
jgi:PAS domain S-box-containing protein